MKKLIIICFMSSTFFACRETDFGTAEQPLALNEETVVIEGKEDAAEDRGLCSIYFAHRFRVSNDVTSTAVPCSYKFRLYKREVSTGTETAVSAGWTQSSAGNYPSQINMYYQVLDTPGFIYFIKYDYCIPQAGASTPFYLMSYVDNTSAVHSNPASNYDSFGVKNVTTLGSPADDMTDQAWYYNTTGATLGSSCALSQP